MKVLQFKVPYMTLGGRSILVILWSRENITKRTFGTLTERSHMVLCWSFNNVPGMTLGGRSILVILWSRENLTKRPFRKLTECPIIIVR